jgi:thiamine-phosphate diphosphorylase
LRLTPFPNPVVCLVTDRAAIGRPLPQLIEAAAAAGVDWIQIRERGLDDRELLQLTRDAIERVRPTPARVIVNDRADVALAAQASGVHLPGDAFPASELRRIVPAAFMIGRSVHDEEAAAAAEADGGCDYLVFGTVFPSASKPSGHRVAGLDGLRRVCARVRLPVIAIGGLSVERASGVAAAGAAGIAAIGMFAAAPDLAETVREVRRAFDS